MKLSYEMIQSFGILKNGIALNSYQLRLLGVGSPPKTGWVRELIGTEISDELFNTLMELRGTKEKSERKRVLRKHGVSTSKLFHKIPSDRYLELSL